VDRVVSWHATKQPNAGRANLSLQRAGIIIEEGLLPILKPGTLLEPSGIYLDLSNPGRGPFRALPGQVAGSGNRYVAKRDIPCDLWHRLVEAAAVAGQAAGPSSASMAVPSNPVAAMIAAVESSTTDLTNR
jgi:hypothetical protein